MTVAEIMGKSALIKLRMRKMDDIGLSSSLLPHARPERCWLVQTLRSAS
jgi:hypothetical protein